MESSHYEPSPLGAKTTEVAYVFTEQLYSYPDYHLTASIADYQWEQGDTGGREGSKPSISEAVEEGTMGPEAGRDGPRAAHQE